jgi:hypothetical protein
MHEKLRFIADNLGNEVWFEQNGIVAKEKGEYWVLNYRQHAPKNEYNVLTRGLVLHKNGNVASVPFFRFFNYGEPTAAKVNFVNSDVLQKLDGSLVGVCFPEKDVTNPVWHFRSLLSTHKQDREFAIKGFVLNEAESPLLMEVEPYLKQIKFTDDLVGYSLVFEFISRVNAVITKYQPHEYGLYLIGARHLESLYELSEDGLDDLAKRLEVRRPQRWKANSYEEVLAMMVNFPKDYEGFVIRDRETGERIKIKSEDYLKRHRLLTKLNYKNLIPLWFDGERGEIEAYFPQTKMIFDEVEANHEQFVKRTMDVLLYQQGRNVSRKDVALDIVDRQPRYICSIVFKHIDVKEDQEKKVRQFVREMRVDALIEAWSLKDEIVEDVVSDIIA